MQFDELFKKRSNHIKPGLERMIRAVAAMNIPDLLDTPAILIGGTNGKGGTAAELWNLLRAAGVSAGLFTSPHLIHFRERYICSGTVVDDKQLLDVWQQVRDTLDESLYEELSFFEIATLMAFLLFRRLETRINVIEVGLGGRWDSTNVCQPVASVLVGVAMDHEAFLGDNLRAILREKLGIMRPGRPFYLGSGGALPEDPAALELLEQEMTAQEVPARRWGIHHGYDQSSFFIRRDDRLRRWPLPERLRSEPPYKRANFALAASVFCDLVDDGLPVTGADPGALAMEAELPPCALGRFQWLPGRGPGGMDLLLDVCHNPDGIREFIRGLRSHEVLGQSLPLPGLVSVLGDKDMDRILDDLKGILHPLMLFKIDDERTFDTSKLAARHRDLPVAESFSAALAGTGARREKVKGPLVICGSVMAVGKVLDHYGITPKTADHRGYVPSACPDTLSR